jgi:hypothetical protein
MSRLLPVLAALGVVATTLSAPQSPSEHRIAPLGVSFNTLYVKRGFASPRVGIKVTFWRLHEAVLAAQESPVDVVALRKKLLDAAGNRAFWVLHNSKSEPFCPGLIEEVHQSPQTGDVTLFLDAKASYNSEYLVAFDLGKFANSGSVASVEVERCHTEVCDATSSPASGVILRLTEFCKEITCESARTSSSLLFSGDKGKVQRVKFSNRFSLELGGSGIPAEVGLLTSDLNEEGERVFRTANARRYELGFTLQGVSHFGGRALHATYSELSLKSKLSDHPMDKESAIALGLRMASPAILTPPGASAFGGLRLITSQSLSTSFLIGMYGFRFGDVRAESRRARRGTSFDANKAGGASQFVPIADIKDGIYFEMAGEFGYAHSKRLPDVAPENELRRLIWRPRATLGFTEIKTSQWNLSGEVTYYYLPPGSSGAIDVSNRFVPFVSTTLGLKTSENSLASISYSFGRDPDARFALTKPKLTFKVTQKF